VNPPIFDLVGFQPTYELTLEKVIKNLFKGYYISSPSDYQPIEENHQA